MKKGTRKQRREAFRAAYKEELRKQGLLDKKVEEPEEVKVPKRRTTIKKEEE